MRLRRLLPFAAALLSRILLLPAAEPADGANPKAKAKDDKTPAGVSATDSPEAARKRLVVAPGLKVDLWAAEPLIENVVNFSFDEQGRAYVVETGRRRTSVFDIRSYRDWVDADLSFRTPWDRAAFLKTNVSQDNAAFMRQKQGGFRDFNKDGRLDWRDLEVESERIKLVWDSTGNGVADQSEVFADGFNTSISGVAAGVLTRGGVVYFTSIPDVWKFTPHATRTTPLTPATGTRLHTGFGVHIAYGGHDMHGLKFGPDGKLYWTIADRGAALTNLSRTLNPDLDYLLKFLPDTGAVFRSNPDGSELEVVAIGLRNPQELAFDDFGNLFTADNNADGGDKARWVHIVEGADYGWRYGWQHLPKLGAWNAEMLWGLAPSNTALSYPPPVAHIGHGPAGIAHYPGTGLPDTFRDCFFYADFPGGIRYFRLEPSGASFKVANAGKWLESNSPDEREGKLLWNLYPTDIEFGPDGGAYVLDWVAGWEKTGKGRIWRVHDPAVDAAEEVREVKRLLADGMQRRTGEERVALLGHKNQQVRFAAQAQLVELAKAEVLKHRSSVAERASSFPEGSVYRLKWPPTIAQLLNASGGNTRGIRRVHAIWSLSEVASLGGTLSMEADVSQLRYGESEPRGPSTKQQVQLPTRLALLEYLRAATGDPETRAVAVRALANCPYERVTDSLRQSKWNGLNDPHPVVKVAALQTLGSTRKKDFVPMILLTLRNNADQDATIRHAAVHALVRIGDTDALLAAAKDSSASVRLGACLALRRLMHPGIAQFLDDPDPRIVLEAARAIADLPIESALPQLAALLDPSRRRREESLTNPSDARPQTQNPNQRLLTSSPTEGFVLRRALNAHFRLGQPTNALALAAFAAGQVGQASRLSSIVPAPAPAVGKSAKELDGKSGGTPDLRWESLRVEALELLADWPQPSSRDKITGLWRPLAAREAKPAAAALRPHLASLLAGAAQVGQASRLSSIVPAPAPAVGKAAKESDGKSGGTPDLLVTPAVVLAAIAAVEKLALTDSAPALSALVADTKQPAEVRTAALRTFGHSAFRTPHSALFEAALKAALADASEVLRKEASRLSAAGGGTDAITRLAATLQTGTLGERQSALQSLATLKGKEADDALRKALTQLLEGKLPKELHLDLLEAAAKRTSPSIKERLAQFEAKRDTKDPLAKWRECLTGGDAKAGKILFHDRQEAACARCHKLAGEGGDVGPDLAGLAAKRGREYVLESIVLPNRVIAPGFESLLVVMKNGQSFAGLVKGETGDELTLNSPEDGLLKLKKSDLAKRTPALSPMPESLVEVLTKREIRNLVEFLATAN